MLSIFKKAKWYESKRFNSEKNVYLNKKETFDFFEWLAKKDVDVVERKRLWLSSLENTETFYKTFSSLTSGLLKQRKTQSANNSKYVLFHQFVLELSKDVKFNKNGVIYSPKSSPQIFGTFISEYALYCISPEDYKKHIFEYILNHRPNLSKKDLEEMWKFVGTNYFWEFISLLITSNRAKSFEIVMDLMHLNMPWAKRDGLSSKEFADDFIWAQKNIEAQVAKIKKNHKNFIMNPIFGSKQSGMKADGDLIIDGKLVEIKCSQRKINVPALLEQLVGYVELNELLVEKFEISKCEFFVWNPLSTQFDLIIIPDKKMNEALNLFKDARIEYINLVRKQKDYPDEFDDWSTLIKKAKKNSSQIINCDARKILNLYNIICNL